MKINPSLPGLDQGKATTGPAGDRGASGTSATGSGPAQGDTIHISALSAQLQALEATLSTGGEFDRTKVDAIKEAIRDGRLTVNADVVADKMLASTLAIIGKDKG